MNTEKDYFTPLPEHNAQCGQDDIVDTFYLHSRGGVFVEIGAFDGVTHSNTVFLERNRGWTGLCAEPNPESFQLLKKNRECACVNSGAGRETSSALFKMIGGYAAACSTTAEHFQEARLRGILQGRDADIRDTTVRITKTQDLFDAESISKIDYLSIDTDGSEIDVLMGIEWSRMDIGIISVESIDQDQEIRRIILSNGFQLMGRAGWDDLFMCDKYAAKFSSMPKVKTERGTYKGFKL